MSEVKSLNLIQKLNEASKHIGAIDKDGSNNFQKYKFQSETAIKYAVERAIRDVGIRIIPSYEIVNQYDKAGKKGGSNHFVDVMGTFIITDGIKTQQGSMPGSGQDTGEKAMAKACTSSQKYFYKQIFNITDRDEDPDSDDSKASTGTLIHRGDGKKDRQESKPEPITSEQKKDLSGLFDAMSGVTQTGLNEVSSTFLNAAKVKDINELTRIKASNLIERVTKILNDRVEKGKKTV